MSARPTPIALDSSRSVRAVRERKTDGRWYWKVVQGKKILDTFWAHPDEVRERAEVVTVHRPKNFSALIEQWYESPEFKSFRPMTQQSYQFFVKTLDNNFGELIYPTNTDMEVLAAGWSHSYNYFRLVCTTGNSLHRWALKQKLVTGISPFKNKLNLLPSSCQNKTRPKETPTLQEVELFISRLTGQYQLLYQVLRWTGMRIGEALKLSWDDIDISRQRIRVHGKAGKERIIPLAPQLKAILINHQDFFSWSEPNQIYKSLKRTCQRRGWDYWHPHSIRRFLIDDFRKNGILPQVAAVMFGHSPQIMMKIYETIQTEELHQAAEKVFGCDVCYAAAEANDAAGEPLDSASSSAASLSDGYGGRHVD